MVTAGCLLSDKLPWYRAGRSSPSIAEFRNCWCYASIASICVHGVEKDEFVFMFISILMSERIWHLLNFSVSPHLPPPRPDNVASEKSSDIFGSVPAFVLWFLLTSFRLLFDLHVDIRYL